MKGTYTTPENREWKLARRAAFAQDILASFTRRPADLMSFEHVQQKLQLRDVHYLGLQGVPLAQIVGSVGRYTDFNRFFFPRKDNLRERWQQIEQLRASGRELPPVELYKIGGAYFVRDGNHRVSVARQRNMSSLEALVWEYETPVPLEPDSDVDALLCEVAHDAFVERTGIDRLCSGHQIRLSGVDGYEDLLQEIEAYRQIFSRIDRRELPRDEALRLWYDVRYTPIVEIIRRRHILEQFPGQTETDLYLWLHRNRDELEASYGQHVFLDEAARDLARRFGRGLSAANILKRAAWWLTSLVRNRRGRGPLADDHCPGER
jgi:hypothetical protein